MLPYKKNKTHGRTSKGKGKPKQQLEEDVINMNSASIHWGTFGVGLVGKKSNKARIKAIMPEENSSKTPEDNYGADSRAPTLMSLLKANPNLINTANRVDKSSNLKDSKKDHVGVFEIFRVNQDMFFQVLQDSPPKKSRLTRSGTFPARNPSHSITFGRTPSKVEHKHIDIWPVTNHGRELRRAMSQMLGRTSSFNESIVRNCHLFDAASSKEIKKHLSRSLRVTNDKDSLLPSDHHGRRSFNESSYFATRALTLDSPKDVHPERVAESHMDQQEEHIANMTFVGNCEINPEIDSVSASEVCFEEDETTNAVLCPIPKDCLFVSNTMPTVKNADDIRGSIDNSTEVKKDMDYYNEDLQYVKYVMDVIGFSSGEDQFEGWHSVDQPLDPAMFDGIEVCCPFEPKPAYKEGVGIMPSSHRKILFDLLNEALVYIHERSYVYYPKALSFNCHVCPVSKGRNQVVEVWEFISKYLSWRPELDQTLELAVANEMSENSTGWMNLQADSECIALDLEDLILDELLDEIVGC